MDKDDLEYAIELIDAAIFSGGCGGKDGILAMTHHVSRWQRGLLDLASALCDEPEELTIEDELWTDQNM